jgi:hypothetical protein
MAEKGQTAIIVGASSVIGEALARELHKEVGALDFCRGAQKDYRPLGRIWETEYRLAMSKFQSTIASTDFTQLWKKQRRISPASSPSRKRHSGTFSNADTGIWQRSRLLRPLRSSADAIVYAATKAFQSV